MQPSCSTTASDHQACLVCGADAHGIHFQVNSCRACAAFFRRAVEGGKVYKCRRATNNCDVSKDTAHHCRLCRFEKCKKIGMSFNNNPIKHKERPKSQSRTSPRKSPLASPSNSAIVDAEEVVFEDHKLKCKAEDLIVQIKDILLNHRSVNPAPDLNGVQLSPMQTLVHSYNSMVPGGKPERIEFVHAVDIRQTMHFFKEMMKRTAVWMMSCQEFAALPMDDKWKIYVNFWPHMYNVERASRTIEYLGTDVSQRVLFTDTVAIDLHNYELIIPNMSPEKQKEMRLLSKPHDEATISQFFVPVRDLNMTTFEVVYLCSQLMWSVKKVKGLAENTYKTASRMLDRIGNELHNYYVYDMRRENYAPRLAKIMRLMSETECLYRDRKNAMLTADVFGIFNTDLHDSELMT